MHAPGCSVPDYQPVRVILPDNAWEMGYTSFEIRTMVSHVCAIARRQHTQGGEKQRYQTILPPSAKVNYKVYADIFRGEWQNGLRLMFRDRYLHDLEKFDNSLYERSDLAWIRNSYLIILQMAWDREFYDRTTGRYTFPNSSEKVTNCLEILTFMVSGPHGPRLVSTRVISGTSTGTFPAALPS